MNEIYNNTTQEKVNDVNVAFESKKISTKAALATIACGAVLGVGNLINGQSADALVVTGGSIGLATLLYVGINQLDLDQNNS